MLKFIAELDLKEAKRIEHVLMIQRWLYIPALLLAAYLFNCLFTLPVLGGCVFLSCINIVVSILNSRIASGKSQFILSCFVLGCDTVVVGWGSLYLAYSGTMFVVVSFFLIVAEAAVRFELKGSLVLDIICSAIIYLINYYGKIRWGIWLTIPEYLLLIGIMSFVSLMIGMVARSARKQRHAASVLIHEKALIEERHRMSNELHDNILKSLQGLSMEAYALGVKASPEIKAKTDYMIDVCGQMTSDIRTAVLELRNDTVRLTLSQQLKNLCYDFQNKNNINTEFVLAGNEIDLTVKLIHDLYSIAREALFNVKKHADAEKVSVKLIYSDNNVILEIKDDGIGIDTIDDINQFIKYGKIGLASMQERVTNNNGLLSIENDNGTLIRVNVPISVNK